MIEFMTQTPAQTRWTHRAPTPQSRKLHAGGQAKNPAGGSRRKGLQGMCLHSNCQIFQLLAQLRPLGRLTMPVATSHQDNGVSWTGSKISRNLLFYIYKSASHPADRRLKNRLGMSLCDVEHESRGICRIRARLPQPFDMLFSSSPAPLAAHRGSGTMRPRDQTNTDDRQVYLPRELKERSSERIRR